MLQDLTQLDFLVVDDDTESRVLTRDILNTIGVGSVGTIAGNRIFAELQARPYDIVILEREMAPQDGIEWTRKIRLAPDSPNPHIPILMVTLSPTREIVTAARDAGVTEFLIRPFSVKDLHARLSAIVNQPRSFVKVSDYFGPDRRRVDRDFMGEDQRRKR